MVNEDSHRTVRRITVRSFVDPRVLQLASTHTHFRTETADSPSATAQASSAMGVLELGSVFIAHRTVVAAEPTHTTPVTSPTAASSPAAAEHHFSSNREGAARGAVLSQPRLTGRPATNRPAFTSRAHVATPARYGSEPQSQQVCAAEPHRGRRKPGFTHANSRRGDANMLRREGRPVKTAMFTPRDTRVPIAVTNTSGRELLVAVRCECAAPDRPKHHARRRSFSGPASCGFLADAQPDAQDAPRSRAEPGRQPGARPRSVALR